jgi:DnaJ-domain-containing protein 1
MTLDHDSGEISGEITQGPYAGRRVEALELDALRDFYQQCQREDPEAIRLLDAYIQRHRAEEWEPQEPPGGHEGATLAVSEAWAILGLEPGASREEVLKAYKRMMLRVHPDRGGSNYLAARINEAKELLLRQF